MREEARQRVRAAALEVVESQLREDNPPETRETLERLIREGHPAAEAKRLIAAVVLMELVDCYRSNSPFDPVRFASALDRLPALPDDGEDEG
jgi:hypothetical protein